MNKQIIIIALLAIVSIGACAQQSITVRDSLTQAPIAYASVWFGNEAGGYTDESGVIEIPDGTEHIRLSHICYETKSLSFANITNQTMWIVPKKNSLGEVIVSAEAPKRMKTTKVGQIKEKSLTCHRGSNGFEMALFIPYDSTWTETPYIHSILASLDYSTHWLTFTTIKTPIYATLRFDLRLPDAETGAPRDESIISGGVLCQPDQRIGKDGVKLPYPILFPQTGVFVVLEWITTAKVSESHSLVPSLNMTMNVSESQTWNRKTFRRIDWMREQDEPIYQDESTREFYKGRIPCAKLGLEITK